MVITEPAVASTRLLGLGSKLYPSNMQRMLNRDLTQFMESFSRIRQNQASQRKVQLAGWDGGYLVLSIPCFFDQFFYFSITLLCLSITQVLYKSPRGHWEMDAPRGWYKIYWFQLFVCSQQLSNNRGCKNLVSSDCHISHVVKRLKSSALDHPIILISLFKHASQVSYWKFLNFLKYGLLWIKEKEKLQVLTCFLIIRTDHERFNCKTTLHHAGTWTWDRERLNCSV